MGDLNQQIQSHFVIASNRMENARISKRSIVITPKKTQYSCTIPRRCGTCLRSCKSHGRDDRYKIEKRINDIVFRIRTILKRGQKVIYFNRLVPLKGDNNGKENARRGKTGNSQSCFKEVIYNPVVTKEQCDLVLNENTKNRFAVPNEYTLVFCILWICI